VDKQLLEGYQSGPRRGTMRWTPRFYNPTSRWYTGNGSKLDYPPERKGDPMPIKSYQPILPYLDPQFDSTHPSHSLPPIEEDPLLPLGKTRRAKLEKERLDQAIASYSPPHVLRSWETNADRAKKYDELMAMSLPDRPNDLIYRPSNLHDSSATRFRPTSERESQEFSPFDFRRFAEVYLHLGYWRIHSASDPTPTIPFTPAMYSPHEFQDPTATPPGDICWILEYTDSECRTIRRKLAAVLGLYPAVTDETNQMYDNEQAWRYENRMRCRCRLLTSRCIRPSHLEIFVPTGHTIP